MRALHRIASHTLNAIKRFDPITPAWRTTIAPGANTILFVHGLGAGADKSWATLARLCGSDEAFEGFNISAYSYPTSKLWLDLTRRLPNISQLAQGLSTEISSQKIDIDKLTIVSHSLGGLIAKSYIVNQIKSSLPTPRQIALYAVPHNGSKFANYGRPLSPTNLHLQQLAYNSDFAQRLEEDWRHLQAAKYVEVIDIVGGLDNIVPPNEAFISSPTQTAMLIGYNHTDIIHPRSSQDIRYIVLRDFISPRNPVAHVSQYKPGSAKLYHAQSPDPLFDIYAIRHEKYYLQRKVDSQVLLALTSGNAWLAGKSGAGKTAVLRRTAYQAGWRVISLMLGAYENATPPGLLRGLCLELAGHCLEQVIPASSADEGELISFFRQRLRELSADSIACILIEEIPLSDARKCEQFTKLLLDLSYSVEVDPELSGKVCIAIASIERPAIQNNLISKFWERFKPIAIDYWDDYEIDKLIVLVSGGLGMSLSSTDTFLLRSSSDGSPRFVKSVLSRIHNHAGDAMTMAQAVLRVKSENL